MKMKNSVYFQSLIVIAFAASAYYIASCSSSGYEPPETVVHVMDKSGDNRHNLEEVLEHYNKNNKVIEEEAAFFLISNMEGQGYLEYSLKNENDETLDFSIFDYPTYDDLLKGWDSIKKREGEIRFTPDTFVEDERVITASFLIENIDLACEAWDRYPWCGHLDFNAFCEYILPYRGSNEPLESWRPYFHEKLKWVIDSVNNPEDPAEAATLVNNYIMSWFRFDPRYYEHPTDQGLNEMLENKKGRCEDMTNLAIYAMRSIGIPVMADFTPYWANTGNNHAWNAVWGANDSVIIFMGGEANPGEYKLANKFAKVYRKTFANQKSSVAMKLPEGEKAPPYLDKKNILDVTDQYTKVENIDLNLTDNIPDSASFAYLCVFNDGKWKAIAGAETDKNRVKFRKMGLDIVYLPALYVKGEIIPAGNAFIADSAGKITRLAPDKNINIDFQISHTTTRAMAGSSETSNLQKLKKGEIYSLYYWENGWQKHSSKKSEGNKLAFTGVPSGAVYWLVSDNSRKEERIFTLDEAGKIWWW